MQTDLWLTEAGNFEKCPLCNKLLKRGTRTCYACGFSNETPSVWIDSTVRTYQQVMPPHTTRDLTPDPQAASPVWQYESPDFEAAGSLPMLSMFATELPTQPQPPVPNRAITRRLPDVDEIDTVPPRGVAPQGAERGEAFPPAHGREQRALVIAPQGAPAEAGSRSWTAGSASGSPWAQLIVRPGRRKHLQALHPLRPLDEARWWLLRPGRIEFILWLGGTLLLIGVTCLLLLVFALSFQWFAPFAPASPLASSMNGSDAQQHSALAGDNGPALALVGTNSITPGQSFQLSGHGFKPAITIAFYFDGNYVLLDQHHRPARVRTDAHGSFLTTLLLTGSSWASGQHIIAVREVPDTPLYALTVLLSSSSTNTGAIASSSSAASATPGGATQGTATPTGPQGTPVNRTPVPGTPTVTPTPATPTVTPTVKPSPTISPTVKPSPTTVPTSTGGTPPVGVSHTGSNSGLSNALNDSGAPPTSTLGSVSPLVWIMVACYLISMFCLGAAGVMQRRNKTVTKV